MITPSDNTTPTKKVGIKSPKTNGSAIIVKAEITQAADADNIQTAVEKGKRAFALKKYEQAAEHYAAALELLTTEVGENHPDTADLYFAYGRALLENAIAHTGVLAKEDKEEESDEDEEPQQSKWGGGGAPIFSFSGDENVTAGDEDPEVDLLEHATKAIAAAEAGETDGDEEEGEEPEDDFNAAWEVLDLARAIYDKQVDEAGLGVNEEIELKLADTYICLGDISLETEKFDQAITDFEAGLALKDRILPVSSRQLAEAHYKLSMVLDLTSGRLQEAIHHAEKALESVETRLSELQTGLAGTLPSVPADDEPKVSEIDAKGKGKAMVKKMIRDDLVQKMTIKEIESELKELTELREDLALKVDELKTQPNENTRPTAPALAAQALDSELNIKPAVVESEQPPVVNDLTSIVKKKKKNTTTDMAAVSPGSTTPASAAPKRKAEDDVESSPTDKKLKLDSETTAS